MDELGFALAAPFRPDEASESLFSAVIGARPAIRENPSWKIGPRGVRLSLNILLSLLFFITPRPMGRLPGLLVVFRLVQARLLSKGPPHFTYFHSFSNFCSLPS